MYNNTIKYIQGICALYGYNPEIFNYDDITPELLKKLEFSKFAKSIRKYLYFSGYELYKGENINAEYINFIIFDILKITSTGDGLFLIIPKLVERLKNENFIVNPLSNTKYNIQDILMLELLIIVALEKFKPSEFANIDEYINIINYKDEFMEKWNFIIEKTSNKLKSKKKNVIPEFFFNLELKIPFVSNLYLPNSPLNYSKDTLKDKLLKMEKNGLEVDISTIKYAYTYIRYKNLENEVKQLETELNLNPVEVTNPKIKEICDLLEYAPDTFKDKIIQKLNEYKLLEDF